MRLMRETTEDGSCKYALLRLDKLDAEDRERTLWFLRRLGTVSVCGSNVAVEIGGKGDTEESFTLKLKDVHAEAALRAYAASCAATQPDLSADIVAMADRAAALGHRKEPD